MAVVIETPYGPYEPRMPTDSEMASATAVVRDVLEVVAEANHDAWAAGRIADGWRYGRQRDDDRKQHPGLVAYEHLPDEEKQYDRRTAKAIVAELMRQGILCPA